MDSSGKNILLKTLLPVLIGVGVVVWLFGSEFSVEQFKRIPLTSTLVWSLLLATLMVVGREAGMMWRWRVLTDRDLSMASCFRVTMLCEFTSAITPTTAGGSALSMVFLSREGINLGRSTTITLTTLMLDELFAVVACPIIFLCVPVKEIFGFSQDVFNSGVATAFWLVYAGICLVTLFLFLGALVMPHRIASFLNRVTRVKILRRWHDKAHEMGDNMVVAGKQLRHKPLRWWSEAFGATALSWICRYLVVNALFLAIASSAPQLIVFARQFVVWTLLTVSPTPGGSGISEWLFTNYYGDLIGDVSMALVIAVLWRIFTYYIYLIVGVCVLPRWLRRRA